jgi:predicted kinase
VADATPAEPGASRVPAVVLTGAPATGKSTLGRLLARGLPAALVDQDVATGPMLDVVQRVVGVDDLDDERLATLTRAARYEVLAALAVDNLGAGVPVVLVAPYTAERDDPAAWSRLAGRLEAAGGAPLLAWLSLDPPEILRRLRERGAVRDRPKLVDEDAYLAVLARLAREPATPHLALAADEEPARLVRRVLEAVRH